MKYQFLSLILIIITFTGSYINTQTLSNLDVINSLIDKSANKVNAEVKEAEGEIYLNVSCQSNLLTLKNGVIAAFGRITEYNIAEENRGENLLQYSLEDAGVRYRETFRDGLFGDYFVEREVILKGSYFYTKREKITKSKRFSLTVSDTVSYDDLPNLENPSLPFTRNTIPPEPFFYSLLEPAIAIGTIVITIFLFFTVRSK